MVREVVHDPIFLGGKSEPATAADLQVLFRHSFPHPRQRASARSLIPRSARARA